MYVIAFCKRFITAHNIIAVSQFMVDATEIAKALKRLLEVS